jgi:hypothetical protein
MPVKIHTEHGDAKFLQHRPSLLIDRHNGTGPFRVNFRHRELRAELPQGVERLPALPKSARGVKVQRIGYCRMVLQPFEAE